MIGYLKGVVRFCDDDAACVDVGGVGYRVLMPAHDVLGLSEGKAVEVFVHTHVREDALVLFGFLTREALKLFERLLACQGVGPKMALGLLSGVQPRDLVRCIAEGDEARLTKIPGVGKKTAARIVLELRDKFAKESLGGVVVGVRTGFVPLDDLRSALANLGYKTPQIDRAVQKTRLMLDQGTPLNVVVTEALKHVS